MRQVTFLIMLCSSVMAFAQKAYLSVTVNPIDAITESTLTQARVSLISTIDSTEVDTFRRITILGDVIKRYTYVYDNSHATLPFKRIVRVESEGYETSYYDLNILPSEAKHGEVAHNIGVIRLHRERNHNLNEATVTASRIMMVMKGDTLVYDANAFQLAEGSMLDALIRQLPGVRLESGGRITVNGHFVSILLVNGKDFFNGDPKVALQNLPAYMVNKVKTYQKTPDDAYLTRSPDEKGPRMDDPWVLDVALKPQYAQSYIANAELAHSVYFCIFALTKGNFHYDPSTKQALQHIQGGTRFGVPARVLHGAWGTANVPAGRDAGGGGRAGTVGGLRGAGLLQVYGEQQRGGQGILHGLRLRGRVRGRLPLLPRRRGVGGEHQGGHALRGAHHQRTRAASTVQQRPEDDAPQRADTEEPVQDGL